MLDYSFRSGGQALADASAAGRIPATPGIQLRPLCLSLAGVLLPFLCTAQILIQDARIIDGSGAPEYSGSVRVEGDLITAIGDLEVRPGDRVVPANGLVLAPGFIDTHSHHDSNILGNRGALAAVSQGITTIVRGQDGDSGYADDRFVTLADFNEMIRQTPVAINIASYSGHNSIREEVLGDDVAHVASHQELDAMTSLLREDLAAGALGLATGLEYVPGMYAATEEVIALAAVARDAGGRYISHIRSEDVAFWSAVDEIIRIGKETGMPVQIAHIKLASTALWGQTDRLLRLLNEARASGVDITADIYPYTYWQSTITILFPDRDYGNRETAEFALREVVPADGLIIARYEEDPSLAGKNLTEVARILEKDPPDALMDLAARADRYNKQQGRSTETIIATSMRNDDIATLMRWPHTNISSDGSLSGKHPRGAGAFPRVLGRYVREDNILDLETAIHKMSALSAEHVGIVERGTIRPGSYADLVLFDPDTVLDHATVEHPERLASGIEQVWVNGQTVFHKGETTGAFPGAIISRQ